jgi:hypothetical protein
MKSKFYTRSGEMKTHKCNYCGRLFVKKSPHRCKGTLRRRRMNWTSFSPEEILIMTIE